MTSSDAGFSIHDRVFSRHLMFEVLAALDGASLIRTRAGARHVLAVPAVRSLAHHPALLEIARGYVGSQAVVFRATLFDKSGVSNWLVTWHQDTALPMKSRMETRGWGPWSIKGGVVHAIAPVAALERLVALRVHLDDSGVDNGPLRVLPHTHTSGVLAHEDIQKLALTVAPVECVTAGGGVVAMRPLAVHASSKALTDRLRRVLHIEYAPATSLAGGELALGWRALYRLLHQTNYRKSVD
jgi:ectoine hydroxylase-related dioxygenase (phytanoyl-CoA dioxygenase family)